MKGLSVLILAAGSASRMNRAKMLLPIGDTTLLQKIIDAAKGINPDCICVVTGAYHQKIIETIQDQELRFVLNENWQDGMAGSIKKGLAFLRDCDPAMKSVLILVADQPFVSTSLFASMLELQLITNRGIIAAHYAGVNGTPVLFKKDYFSSLEELSGDKGARALLQQFSDDLSTVDFPLGEFDIDTEEDYHKIQLK